MALTPVEIRHLAPPRTTFRGYRVAATDKLFEEIAASFEDVWRERADLADRVEQLETDLVEETHVAVGRRWLRRFMLPERLAGSPLVYETIRLVNRAVAAVGPEPALPHWFDGVQGALNGLYGDFLEELVGRRGAVAAEGRAGRLQMSDLHWCQCHVVSPQA